MSFLKNAIGFGVGGLGGAYAIDKGFRGKANDFLFGKDEQNYSQSLLSPGQQSLQDQYQNSIQNRGAGGAFGQSADYYRDLLGNNSQDFQNFAAPQMRQFNEEIIPGLSEQFAGMGSGGLSSSGFRNAAVNAGTDLSERLGAIRANLRNSGAQGLAAMGQGALAHHQENIHRPATGGFVGAVAEGAGKALGKAGAAFLGGL